MIDFANGKFSQKALDFIQNSDARLNILHGSVRSSKTVNCTVRWLTFCLDGPPGDFIMVGKTVGTLQRNVLNDIIDIVGPKQFHWENKQQGVARLLGRRVYIVGAASEESESKIRGATFAGALCDEISLYPRSFVDMLLTRLSIKGACCFCNCNPGDPAHWFYKDFICNEEITNKKVWHFTLDDNPNLDEEYKLSLIEQFKSNPVFYERFILGKWVVAEGAIYNKFANSIADGHESPYIIDTPPLAPRQRRLDLQFCTVGLDFGGNESGQAMNLTGYRYNLRGIITLDELFSKDPVDAFELADMLVEFLRKNLKKGYPIIAVYCDHAETVLVRTMKRAVQQAGLPVRVLNCVKYPIIDRIHFYNALFGHTNKVTGDPAYQIMSHCKHTIQAFQEARWKEDHEDVRLDDFSTNIDNLDAQEYSTEHYQKQIIDALHLNIPSR